MKWTQGYLFTLKDSPADAEIPSHKLLARTGMIRKLGQGVYTYGPLLLRSIRKFESIIREEHQKAHCIEMLMPMVQPRELWEETNRWEEMGKGLLKFRNRLDQDWCLGATHEEVITDYVRKDIKSYRDLPKTLFQIQTKYRDEIRPRFGLMRGREFIMKDAYSFDLDEVSANESYDRMYKVYENIFNRLGADFRVVKADSGNIGGDKSQEFHILADSGEDALMVSETSDFAANVEVCPAIDMNASSEVQNFFNVDFSKDGPKTMTEITTQKGTIQLAETEEFSTPKLRTIDDLSKATGVAPEGLVKTMFFSNSDDESELKPIAILLRGSDEVNEIKLKNVLGLANPPRMLGDEEVKQVTGAMPGSCGPVGLEIPIYMDAGVLHLANYIVGANKDDFHIKNVNHPRDFKTTAVVDIRLARPGDKDPESSGPLKLVRGIEVGHIFYLGTKYSKAMNANYLDNNGKSRPIEMGCYGIGVTRTVQAVIEQNNDDDGMIWPAAIAPYTVHICLLDPKDEKVTSVAQKLYDDLWANGIDCLMDDRDERPGVKFKDADLLGMPLRVVVGGRGVEKGELEVVERKSKDKQAVAVDQTLNHIMSWWKKQSH